MFGIAIRYRRSNGTSPWLVYAGSFIFAKQSLATAIWFIACSMSNLRRLVRITRQAQIAADKVTAIYTEQLQQKKDAHGLRW